MNGVELSGPFFSADVAAVAQSEFDTAREELARTIENRVHARLQATLQNPTGYYESRVVSDRASADSYEVHDSNVIYGPWLEGVGSRNAETRFKGYASFRLAAQGMDSTAHDIVEDAAERIARRLS